MGRAQADGIWWFPPPELSGGTPVSGTRVPVYDIAALRQAGIPTERIPRPPISMMLEKVELDHESSRKPIRREGRPSSGAELPEGAVIIPIVRCRRKEGEV